ncbi:MAG: phosphoglycerate kinase [Anaerolineales bacterium]
MNKKTIRDVDFSGKRVLIRVDFNVPLKGVSDDKQEVADDTRIRAAVPTIQYILEQNPKMIILMTHVGRPKGQIVPKLSVKPIAPVLADLLGIEQVLLAPDNFGKFVDEVIENAPDGAVIIMQNTRYHEGETENDPEMAAALAKYGDIFVNDAFGTAHRAHASNVGVAQHLEAVAGFLMQKELDFLSNAVENPERPFVAIMGGAKIIDKVQVIEKLLSKVDTLIVGGGMGNTFLKASGVDVGASLVDEEALSIAEQLLKDHSDKIMLPKDVVIASEYSNNADRKSIAVEKGVDPGWQILDTGPATLEQIKDILSSAKTVIWNGPVGVFEMPNFAIGTTAIANMLAELTEEKGLISIIGGGDSASAVAAAGVADKMTHVSTGGGASLELLEGKELPGVAALADK